MLERVVENWLTEANERSLEIPYCQLLSAQGYCVMHMSRHGPFEQGKDILAIASDGTPCAFQLKSILDGKLKQTQWAKIVDQIIRLVEVPIQHPSIDSNVSHRPVLVINGELDEEVRLEIVNRNFTWQQRGFHPLEVQVKGDLLPAFVSMSTNLRPLKLVSEKSLLELFLADGRSTLDKRKFASLLMDILPFETTTAPIEAGRALSRAALITAFAMSPYEEKSNHVALVEGWTIFYSYLVALVHYLNLSPNQWQNTLDVAVMAVERSLEGLVEELRSRKSYVEGDPIADAPFYRGRITWLVGFVSAYALWHLLREPNAKLDSWYKNFVLKNADKLLLWGEGAVPAFATMIWYHRQFDATIKSDRRLTDLIMALCNNNSPISKNGIPNPYIGLGDAMLERTGLKQRKEEYRGQSYTLESLVHLFARRNFKRDMKLMWPAITQITFVEYVPDAPWQYCLWQNDEAGLLQKRIPNQPQSWKELRKAAADVEIEMIPSLFVDRPELLILFLLVYPHRWNTNFAKILDDRIAAIKYSRVQY